MVSDDASSVWGWVSDDVSSVWGGLAMTYQDLGWVSNVVSRVWGGLVMTYQVLGVSDELGQVFAIKSKIKNIVFLINEKAKKVFS